MSLTLGALESLEQVLADAISADAALAGIAVHVDAQKNLVDEITAKIAKLNTLIVPYVSKASDDDSGIEGVNYGEVEFSISVFQNPKIVTTGLSARAVAERIAAIVKGNAGWPRNVSLRTPTIEHIPDGTLNIYQVNGRTAADGLSLTQLPAITSSVAGGNVTLACAQPGAAVFYTTNGTLPTTSSTLYTAPFASSGQTINARAWLAGFLATNWFKLTT